MPQRIHPKPVSLAEIFIKFSTDDQCLDYIQNMRWPDGVIRCTVCGNDKIVKVERKADSKNRRKWFYLCQEKTCHNQFSPTSGTLFADSHLPLLTWFHAIGLMLNAKKGISAKQLQRDLGIGGYKTAWYLNHRIREAMGSGDIPKLGGTVEIDETYIGGKLKGKGVLAGKRNKKVVVGIRQRKGPLRFIHAADAKAITLKSIIDQHVSADVECYMTDESTSLNSVLRKTGKHQIVNHTRGEYVRGDTHTNTIESAFGLFKRGIVGQFHKVSIKHLQRYLDEFTYRFDRRNNGDVFIETVRRLCGFKPLRFAELTSDPETAAVPF